MTVGGSSTTVNFKSNTAVIPAIYNVPGNSYTVYCNPPVGAQISTTITVPTPSITINSGSATINTRRYLDTPLFVADFNTSYTQYCADSTYNYNWYVETKTGPDGKTTPGPRVAGAGASTYVTTSTLKSWIIPANTLTAGFSYVFAVSISTNSWTATQRVSFQ